MIRLKEVKTKEEEKAFLLLPWKIYKDDPYWVPPLLEDVKFCLSPFKNPFYQHA